jgi:hypothetical protein
MAECASHLEPSAAQFASEVPVAAGWPEGILGESIEHKEHNCYANTAGYTEQDRLNHFSTSATMHTCITVTGGSLSLLF